LNFVRRMIRVYTKEHMALGFRTRLFGHVERLSLSYHDEKGPSESTFRILMDTATIPAILLDGLIPSLQSMVLLIAISAVILTISPSLAFVAIAVAPLLLLISLPFGKSLRQQWHDIKELDASILGRLQEVFSAVRVIKVFGREDGETDRLFKVARKAIDARMRVARTQSWFSSLSSLLTASGTALFLVLGGQMVKDGAMSLGDMILIAALMLQFYSPLQQVVGQVASMQSALASAERVLALLDKAPEVYEKPDAKSVTKAAGAIEFRDVSFSYEEGTPVLNRLGFAVEVGQRIGIAGHTGAGKTTIVNLMTRLYDPQGGAILLDGDDLRDLKIDDLRHQFSIVLQDPVLFKKSISENILYARPEASQGEVEEAARLANAHGFISEMRDGYDTVVGDRGQRLSGGERQRISLARAFLKNAPILVLDEPTSSVDMRTEAQIMDALDRLMRDRTTLIIAHRPSTLSKCDKVLVVEKGRMVNFAPPDALGSLDELMLSSNERRPAEGSKEGV
ncbi:MAG: ABC transporter ATP-binding protein, partial [Planctomycetota bacterium]|nr:ABC transporter ATP-binding protein [Planctomycetota bacterium]